MITNPGLATQLAREHQRQMRTQASQQRHQHGRPVPGPPNAAAIIFCRLSAAIASVGRATARRHLASSPPIRPANHPPQPGPGQASLAVQGTHRFPT